MDISHAIAIIISGKNLASPALKSAGAEVSQLSQRAKMASTALALTGNVGAAALAAGLAVASAGVAALGNALVTVLKAGLKAAEIGIKALAVSLTALATALTVGLHKLTDYAAGLDLMKKAMWGIAGEAAPAMLSALKKASNFMVTEKDLIRSYTQSYMLLGKELAEHLPEATRYLAKVAAATGDTTEYLVERLVRSVGRLSTRWMAYIGTVVPMEEAIARATEMFGKEADALTYAEKQAGMLDRALAKLQARTAALPEVMGTVKQMSEALKVSFKDFWGDVGTIFLPAAHSMFTVLTKVGDAIRRLVSEGGALYRPLRTLSATISVLYDLLGDLLDGILDLESEGTSAIERFADTAMQTAWKAFSWGANIAVNLASGVIRGASIALTGAMNFISGLLAFWLAPGSAPRIVSNILDWGASAFTEFLKGFSMAQFDVLEGVQAPLKRALGVLTALELITPTQAGEQFIGLTEDLTAAIAEFGQTGTISTDIFGRLAEVGGGYGESIAELLRRQLDLATAVERLAAAEERLKFARRAEEQANVKLSKSAREYNKLALAGASPAVLKAKLAEVEASYDSLVAAREETVAAEEAKDLAADQVKEQQEQVKLQERLLNQLIEMGQAMVELNEARRRAAEGDAGEEGFVIPPIEFPEFNVAPIDVEFQALKDRIRDMFTGLWADLRTQWEESGVVQAVQGLREAWENFSDVVLRLWGTWTTWWEENGPIIRQKISDIGSAVRTWAEENIFEWATDEWDKWVAWWEEDGPTIGQAVEDTKDFFITLLGYLIDVFAPGWDFTWEGAGHAFTGFIQYVQRIAASGMRGLRQTITLASTRIFGNWEGFWREVEELHQIGWDTINIITGGAMYDLMRGNARMIEGFKENGRLICAKIAEGIGINTEKVRGALGNLTRSAISSLRNRLWEFADIGWNIVTSIADSIYRNAGKIADALRSVINNAIRAIRNTLGMHSASVVMVGLGQEVASSFAQGIEDLSNRAADAAGQMADLTSVSVTRGVVGAGAGGAGAVYHIVNNFGQDSVRSDQDVLAIADAMQRSMELQGIRTRIS